MRGLAFFQFLKKLVEVTFKKNLPYSYVEKEFKRNGIQSVYHRSTFKVGDQEVTEFVPNFIIDSKASTSLMTENEMINRVKKGRKELILNISSKVATKALSIILRLLLINNRAKHSIFL